MNSGMLIMYQLIAFSEKIYRKCDRIMSAMIALPAAIFFILIFPFYKIKLIGLFSDRIGHYAMNTELLLCYLDSIKNNEKRTKYIFYVNEAPTCNVQLHNMWKRLILIVPYSKIAAYVNVYMAFILGKRYKSFEFSRHESMSAYNDFNGYLATHKKHLKFTPSEIHHGEQILIKLGIPLGAKYICLLVRDSAYLDKYLSGNDWSYHSYRDCDIQNFAQSALFLAERGYYILRMGKVVKKPFIVNHPRVIDYANHLLRSDFADIYLSANCFFFISTASGLDAVSKIFRKPALLVNVAPMKGVLEYFYPNEFFIVKKVKDIASDKFLSQREIDHYFTENSNVPSLLNQYKLALVENTADEILDAVVEMEEYLCRNIHKEIYNIFRPLVKTNMPLSFLADRELLRAYPEKLYIKIGSRFWDKNKSLFLEQSQCCEV